MRRAKTDGGFFLCLLYNMMLSFEWTIPAWVLLVLHFVLSLPLWAFWVALALWPVAALVRTAFLVWVAGCEPPRPKQENKNPYSPKNEDVFPNYKRD